MKIYLEHIKLLAYRLSLVFIALQLSRIFFYITNYSKYSNNNFGEIIWAFIVGFRFDIVSVGISNSLFIILSILPFRFITKKAYQLFLKLLFISINFILILSNLLDSEYFKFTQKRSTFDVLDLVQGDDFANMITKYMLSYWFVFLILIVLMGLLIKFYPRVKHSSWEPTSPILFAKQFFIITLISLLTFIGIRGLDHKPITITSAADFANPQTVSLALNTPFTIINTFNKKSLPEEHTFKKEELLKIFNPIKKYSHKTFNAKNVVILILESFGKEYSHLNNPKTAGYTPFLDSLSKQALRFRYSFANGKRSIQALPSILNSSPGLMDRAYISSSYSANKVEGLAYLLRQENYYTSFMHGGANGTMYFDKFCYMSGFEDYYGKDEYPSNKDYDGNWGIYDEPYLQYSIKMMSSFKEPFLNAIFTLSSHHPYSIPEKHKNQFPKGDLVIHESIGYSDYALKKFFESAAKTEWYKNTLFILTADHTSISNQYYFQTNLGTFEVPIIFYSPSDSLLKGEKPSLAQHIDIMPSILDYLGYNKAFYAIGNSVFNKNRKEFIINQQSDRFFFIHKNLYAISYRDSVRNIYLFPKDSILKKNIIKKASVLEQYTNESDTLFKAIIQTFNNDLIHNRTYASSKYYLNKK